MSKPVKLGQRFYLVTQGDAYRIAPHYVHAKQVDANGFTLSNGVRMKHTQRNHKYFKLFDSHSHFIMWQHKARDFVQKKNK